MSQEADVVQEPVLTTAMLRYASMRGLVEFAVNCRWPEWLAAARRELERRELETDE